MPQSAATPWSERSGLEQRIRRACEASLREGQWKTVASVATHELDVGVLGRAVEQHGSELRDTKMLRCCDAVLAVDQGVVTTVDHDRRPTLGDLPERSRMARVDSALAD